MSPLGFLLLLLVAAVCGMIGQSLVGYSVGGCLLSAVVGFVGALVGLWFARTLGLPEFIPVVIDGQSFPVVWSIVGSAVLVGIVSLFSRRRWA